MEQSILEFRKQLVEANRTLEFQLSRVVRKPRKNNKYKVFGFQIKVPKLFPQKVPDYKVCLSKKEYSSFLKNMVSIQIIIDELSVKCSSNAISGLDYSRLQDCKRKIQEIDYRIKLERTYHL
jgi:hypothetical protein